MNKKPRLLIIHKNQFGYHTGNFEMTTRLAGRYDITFICFDSGLKRVPTEKINIKYVSANGGYFKRGYHFLKACFCEFKNPYDSIFITYFLSSSLLAIFSRKKIIIDFRTGAVNKKLWKRRLNDGIAMLEAKAFAHVTLISEGLRVLLKVSEEKSSILPLGANVISAENKTFKTPKLFYIGTLNNRNIEQTILGVSSFLNQNPKYKTSLEYNIVGSGFNNEEKKLSQLVTELKLENNIILHGRKSHDEVQALFDSSNIGVSYVPMTQYYDHQPPTKTYEYILSGMACLATATSENKKCIQVNNGILIEDTASAFTDGLEKLVNNFDEFDSVRIRETLKDHTWEKISQDFEKILQKQMDIN